MSETLSDERVGQLCPACPTCKQPLIARRMDRRFMENHTYVACVNAHIWELKAVERFVVERVDDPPHAWGVIDAHTNEVIRAFSVRTNWIDDQPFGPEAAAQETARRLNAEDALDPSADTP